MIQHFLILKRTGENIYKINFGKINMDETVMSGFFSAFFTFTQSLCGQDVQDIELGQYRMLFEVIENALILVIIFDKSDSIINVQQKLLTIKKIIISNYSECIKNPVCRSEDFQGLNEIIERLITKDSTIELTDELKKKSLEIVDKLHSNNEILDCALLSIDGIPLTKGTKKDFLDLIIKQMDAFWKFTKSEVFDQIILYYENRFIILYKVKNEFILCALIRKETPIGLATFLVEEAATKLAQIV
ncbi:MAG: hypothetical protein ACTSRS_01850 [Candidatus Helarchaeota archaeon]